MAEEAGAGTTGAESAESTSIDAATDAGQETDAVDAGELERVRAALKNANKEAEKHRLRAKELEDSTKSDEDKRSERFAELEKSDREKDSTITGLESKLLRYEVAAAKGLDLKAALRLQGSTKEELEADADDFAKSFISGGVGEVPGAGARGETRVQTTPGIGTLTHGYATASK